jgi:hypothetical protein
VTYNGAMDSAVEDVLKEYKIKNFGVNRTGTVDVTGDVDLSRMNLASLPVKFRRVTGNFYCQRNELVSLENAPWFVGGTFICDSNALVSLVGGPRYVGGNFGCAENRLKTLEGGPEEVGGTYRCESNRLVSLRGVPKELHSHFYCQDNPDLASLRWLVAVNGEFHGYGTKLAPHQEEIKRIGAVPIFLLRPTTARA